MQEVLLHILINCKSLSRSWKHLILLNMVLISGKKLLLTNVRSASGIAHLIQKCRDNEYMSFNASAAYLRQNAILIDYASTSKPPTRLMHVDQEEQKGMTLESAAKRFHTMAEQDGLEFTYKVLNTRLLRENLSIPPSI